MAEQAQLFKITVSFGSVTSLISLPCYMSHASIPAALRVQRGLPDDLVRISVGIEDPADLLAGEWSLLISLQDCQTLSQRPQGMHAKRLQPHLRDNNSLQA